MRPGDKVIDTIDNTLWVIRDIWPDGDLTLESHKKGYMIDISVEAFEETFIAAGGADVDGGRGPAFRSRVHKSKDR